MDVTTKQLLTRFPLLERLRRLEPVTWINPLAGSVDTELSGTGRQVEEMSARLRRFAPWLMKAFPETEAAQGIIESDIVAIPAIQHTLNTRYGCVQNGRLLLKKDSHLPISGSIKARGGICEVLTHAERLAVGAGVLNENDDYSILLSARHRSFFSGYRIAVGSTGNLGLSIGIVGARLGFKVSVHMSADARQWKKDRLRAHGVEVIEHAQDYGVAVEEGRRESASDPACYFIDDENSRTLFLGYAVAGERVRRQLAARNVIVNAAHPLFVYLPCGVGGGPGGVAFGLKLAFGDAVHCIFAEPVNSPCMLLGVHTGLHDAIAVQDLGIDNKTIADGLAVGRPSGFVGRTMAGLLCGFYTLQDSEMLDLLRLLNHDEGISLEPSALAGLPGPWRLWQQREALAAQGITTAMLQQGTHLVWATGGGMVPEAEMARYLAPQADK
ncbi:D-serine ammonia-lyase [Erwinia sp. 9145]|uniref:D-serine ammonia-lyase n=1 Tax=Erwinia sp. 9145 TaxID=1500895 RepID=UPI00054E41A9|nr:D-serine ammonia-lyase [Erwinia sp. 9145]